MTRPTILKEKTKRSICLFFASLLILGTAISTGNAFADSAAPASTSEMKMYYQFLRACIGDETDFPLDEEMHMRMLLSTDVKNGKIFVDNNFQHADVSGVIIEKRTTNKQGDGKIRCGENGNELIKKALVALSIGDIKNLVCDYSNPDNPGILKSSSSSCINDLNSGSIKIFELPSTSDRLSYFDKLVEAKTGLTVSELSSFSSAEQYAAYTATFMTSCATDGSTARLENPENYDFQIMIYNTNSHNFVRGGYSGSDRRVHVWRGEEKTCKEIANRLDENGDLYLANKDSLISQLNAGTPANNLGVITDSSVASETEVNDDVCYDKAGVIGWILCPVISTAKDLLNKTYSTIEKEYLQIDSVNLFKRRNDGGMVGDPVPDPNVKDESTLHVVWSSFRDIANVGLVIFLLFVILSQVTGYGIDNYGIKKALPRIIMIGIILNLSYIICEICVDLSNIIGIGIKDIFSGLTSKVTINTVAATGTSGAQSTLVMGGLLAIGIGVLFISPGLILTLALFLISMVISVLFLWVILICRQAGLILAIGISPVAFLCYIFPNTEKLFKRWTSLMKGLLLLYPICTFVISGGMLAGKIFAAMNTSTGNDATSRGLTLAAMIVPVIPYFFIPSLLRNSLKAMGNLGATISKLGRTVNSGTVGKFKKSEAAKRMRTNMNTWDAGGLRSRVSASRFGKITGLQHSNAQRIAAREKMKNEDRAAQALLQREKFARLEQRDPSNVSLSAFEAQLEEAMNSANGGEKYDAILSEIERRFGGSKAADLAMKTIDNNQSSALLTGRNRQEFMRKLAQNHQGTFAKTPDFGKYLQYGGVHRNSVTGATTYTSFSGVNADSSLNFMSQDVNIGDFKDNQISAANSTSIHRMVAAGKITQADAQRIMDNDDIRGSMDSVQQAILAASYNRGGAISGGAMHLEKAEVEAAFAGRSTYVDDQGHTQTVRITQAEANALVAP